jgi:uncharacterized caspase-like protein
LLHADALLFLVWSGHSAFAQDRLALIVGINDYVNVPTLQRAINDAKSVEKGLAAAKFATRLLENPGQRELLEELSKISAQIKPGDIVAVYFAGHALKLTGATI